MPFFFQKISLPKLSEDQTVQVEEIITEHEVRNAILPVKVGKSPGINRLPVEYYKNILIYCRP